MGTGKRAYEERKRLKSENKLRFEQRQSARIDREEEMERVMAQFFSDVGRIADALERLAPKEGE